ncbi:PTS lactose/cellobiose transporter subunit IIA [Olsenella sp. YH-ols2217]|uniref:PTS system lactose-specific EIIA component n=1 Tax=Kribbibacterium absianum TaxID=3044210 RepID=A0ABT6ZKH3_9ACTN|nr:MULTISPECIES: PTS lactose/cellobiose transporter subunit IIA [unclassified Olsenella]MDJ1122437.1 PTS lactose/cellobiose transporter subunit IIA [Olsenella sp. YH-ols2216]MDJ1129309.1 PTS lactose/cellobiose transporter subunit IIA [Olsenella sp. YH-ols2217]
MDKETCVNKAFEIIGYGGDAKGRAYEALELAENGDFEGAHREMEDVAETMVKAHNIQTEFIVKAAQGEEIPMDILFVHSQDHLMCGIEAEALIAHLITANERIARLEERIAALEGARGSDAA